MTSRKDTGTKIEDMSKTKQTRLKHLEIAYDAIQTTMNDFPTVKTYHRPSIHLSCNTWMIVLKYLGDALWLKKSKGGGMKEKGFALGDRVIERVTGFTGVAVARCEYLWGCAQYLIKEECVREDGKITEFWFDEIRLELVKKDVVLLSNQALGGPQSSAPPTIP